MLIARKLFLFIVLIACFFTTSKIYSEVNNQLITELIVTDSDSIFRYLYLYDTNGKKVVETKYFKENNKWTRNKQIEWVYDDSNCITQRESSWRNNNWATNYLINYSENGVYKTETHSLFNNGVPEFYKKNECEYSTVGLKQKKEYERVNDEWSLVIVSNYAYNQINKVDSAVVSVYNLGNVVDSYLNLYSYSESGKLTNQLLKKRNSDGWINSDLISYYYLESTDSIISQRNKKWNSNTQNWENDQKIDYIYDSSNRMITELFQRWNNMFWENDVRYDYLYDDTKKLLKKTLLLPVYKQWRKIVSIDYSNFTESNAQTIESKYEFWGGPTGELKTSFIPFIFNSEPTIRKAEKIEISYLPISDSETAIYLLNSDREFPVYPNPSSGVYYVNTQQCTVIDWVVTDLNGKIVKTQNQMHQSGIIDISELRNGIYILKIKSNKAHIIQKLIKE